MFTNEFSEKIWLEKYKSYSDITLYDTWDRVAKFLSKNENEAAVYRKKFVDLLSSKSFVPGGRIIANAGTDVKSVGLVNCFVSGFRGKHQDSMISIMDELKRQARILKSEGGYGSNFSVLRPNGCYISGIASSSPGVVTMMDLWNTTATVITKGSNVNNNKKAKKSIRKGANMGILDVWHPDIIEFINAKQVPNVLTKFNLSVGIYDNFMHAVKNHLPWDLIFPNIEADKDKYNDTWDGNIYKWQKSGGQVEVYKHFDDASELWDIIMRATYNRAEPGVLFLGRVNHLNNLHYKEYLSATNPCGEQVLPIGGSCVLGSINLTKYVDVNNTTYNYDKLEADLPLMLRFMDNVNDINNLPLEEQFNVMQENRRVGIGYIGYASSLLMMNVTYGSKKALEITEELAHFVTNKLYQASALLAKEKGSFKSFDCNKYLQSNFIKQALSDKTIAMIKEYGIRNSHITSIQPTGTTAGFADNISGGGEPIFSEYIIRTKSLQIPPDGLELPINVNWVNETTDSKSWAFIKEYDTPMLKTTYNGVTYKYKQDLGLTEEVLLEDYAVKFLKNINKWEEYKSSFKSAAALSIDEHIDTMKIFAKYIDSAMSKTINLPNKISFDDFKDVYMKAYDTNVIKGITTYRDGIMGSVLADLAQKNVEKINFYSFWKEHDNNVVVKNVKLPEKYELLGETLTSERRKWYVFTAFKDKTKRRPFVIFTITNNSEKSILVNNAIEVVNALAKEQGIPENLINENSLKSKNQPNVEKFTRAISLLLRHNVALVDIVNALDTIENIPVSSLIFRLKKYLAAFVDDGTEVNIICPSCYNKNTVVLTEGCVKCSNCGWSRC